MNTLPNEESYPVVIVGAGPVGLYLGCLLYSYGISFVILEKRKEPTSHSRSLGIHPVSLELFQELGLAESFAEAGIQIKKGHAFSDNGSIGSISFEECPKPFNFILSLPQYRTEAILENYLKKLKPGSIIRRAEVKRIHKKKKHINIEFTRSGQAYFLGCECLAGCDGKESVVRKQAGIDFKGSRYPDTYIMGDFTDTTGFGNDAAIYLSREGLIESFPLNGGMRRWVVKTDTYIEKPQKNDIVEIVKERIGHDLSKAANKMLSSFGVQKLVAEPMAAGRIALAGDAAHIVSPIGGQGMNLGWLDARDLGEVLHRHFNRTSDLSLTQALEQYNRRRQRITQKVIQRAELNMKLGRKRSLPVFRDVLVWLMLNTPLNKLMSRMFTMRNLDGKFL